MVNALIIYNMLYYENLKLKKTWKQIKKLAEAYHVSRSYQR